MRGGSRSDRNEEREGRRVDLGAELRGMKDELLMGVGGVGRGVERYVVETKGRVRCEMVRKEPN